MDDKSTYVDKGNALRVRDDIPMTISAYLYCYPTISIDMCGG